MKAGERGRACWDKELGTQGWAAAQAAHQEEDVSPAGGGGGWRNRLSASAPRPRGPTGGGSGCVEGSRGQAAGGLGKLEKGLKGLMHPVVASSIFSVSVVTSSGFTCALSRL